MKFKKRVDVNILGAVPMEDPVDFLRAVELYCKKMPNMLPERWDWKEPLRRIFKETTSPKEMACTATGRSCHTYWSRKSVPKAEGTFGTNVGNAYPEGWQTHARICVTSELRQMDQRQLIDYLKAASIDVVADIALIDSPTESYKNMAGRNDVLSYYDREGREYSFSLVTHTLRHWLPDLFWGTVFGPAYVKLFGMDRLLSTPAFAVERIAEDMVYIQLSSSLEDLHTDFSAVQAVRVKAKEHLDNDAFFDSAKAYDWRKVERAGNVPKVFRVPAFEMKSDKFTGVEHKLKY